MTISTHKPETPLKCFVCPYSSNDDEPYYVTPKGEPICSVGCYMQYSENERTRKVK